jgi:hypothetical protein
MVYKAIQHFFWLLLICSGCAAGEKIGPFYLYTTRGATIAFPLGQPALLIYGSNLECGRDIRAWAHLIRHGNVVPTTIPHFTFALAEEGLFARLAQPLILYRIRKMVPLSEQPFSGLVFAKREEAPFLFQGSAARVLLLSGRGEVVWKEEGGPKEGSKDELARALAEVYKREAGI